MFKMDLLFLVVLGISFLFFIFLGIKELVSKNSKKEFCVVCASIFLTWVLLLILNSLNLFQNKIIIAILIGESTLGLFYLINKKFKAMEIFKLPLILTLIVLGYTLLEGFTYSNEVLIFLGILWLFFGFIFFFRKNITFRKFANKLVECCRNF
ncbi:hypothetical protein COT60_03050 [Candidatus Pacearchaeota archaeon CG09_land_8_20_14_0_10_30_9]|nr:MAG: hypothetical protein COV77_03110 [Candidatus Pacearchaeota archaeon CG11_big_fil_rev_8_21_14_0_20_30_13]PIO00946.1 MAG: hypothetical protein COT60_03050 [Candidatus Pacearchaeota archaeon CG09_land_8_20_14_0_10_30_9]